MPYCVDLLLLSEEIGRVSALPAECLASFAQGNRNEYAKKGGSFFVFLVGFIFYNFFL
ncbi:hypothetical protein BGZ63DRAFT_369349 [Mariannaea sp. PMI_226]|nr:hypothetical protein BGZ63DRAFT_369349 [Mariannaea sp. PMI_226]